MLHVLAAPIDLLGDVHIENNIICAHIQRQSVLSNISSKYSLIANRILEVKIWLRVIRRTGKAMGEQEQDLY